MATAIGAPVGITSAYFRLAYSMSPGIKKKKKKKLPRATRNKKKKHNKIIMLARRKLNSIESKVSEALINNEISNEDLMIVSNGEKNYWELKESIRMMKN